MSHQPRILRKFSELVAGVGLVGLVHRLCGLPLNPAVANLGPGRPLAGDDNTPYSSRTR